MAAMISRVLLPLLFSCAAAPGVYAADAFSTDWASTSKAEARLLAGGPKTAGFEIRLAPGAITYWRDPGDSGAPPVFDFSGSVNLARAEPQFPPPARIVEPDGSEAFGYSSDVVFPIAVEPIDPSKPVTLALKAGYAVCEKLCLPAKADLTLNLPATVGSPYASIIGQARASTPRQVAWGSLGADLARVDFDRLAPLLARRARPGARSLPRAAVGLVALRQGGAPRGRTGLFRHRAARQAGRRSVAGQRARHHHRRLRRDRRDIVVRVQILDCDRASPGLDALYPNQEVS